MKPYTTKTIPFALTLLAVFASLSPAQEDPFKNLKTDEEAFNMLQQRGPQLIRESGDALLNWIKYIPESLIGKNDFTGANARPLYRSDYPVWMLLKRNGADTMQLLDTTHFFRIPVHDDELDMIAALLLEIEGREGAVKFATRKALGEPGCEHRNWSRILENAKRIKSPSGAALSHPRDPSKFEAYEKACADFRERKRLERELAEAATKSEDFRREVLLKKLRLSLKAHEEETGKFPSTLHRLVSAGLLNEEDLILNNPDGSISVPTYFPSLSMRSPVEKVVLSAPSEDGAKVISVTIGGVLRSVLPGSGGKPRGEIPDQHPSPKARPNGGSTPTTAFRLQ